MKEGLTGDEEGGGVPIQRRYIPQVFVYTRIYLFPDFYVLCGIFLYNVSSTGPFLVLYKLKTSFFQPSPPAAFSPLGVSLGVFSSESSI